MREFSALKSNLLLRLLICFFISLTYVLYPSDAQIIILFVLLVYLLDLKKYEFTFEGVIFLILLLLQIGIVLALFLAHYFDIAPIGMFRARRFYYTTQSVQTALFVALQQLFILSALLKYKSHKIIRKGLSYNGGYYVVFALLGLILSSYFANRSGTIIEGGYGEGYKETMWGGWSLLFVVCAGILLFHSLLYKRYLVVAVLIGSTLYWLLHANRGEVFVLVLLLGFIVMLPDNMQSLTRTRNVIYFLSLIGFYLLFEIVGDVRGVGLNAYQFKLDFVNGDMLSVSTIGSSAWSLISAINIADNDGYMYGLTILDYFTRLLPSFIPVPWEVSSDIASYTSEAYTRGGSGFAGEAYINFGVFGPPFIAYCLSLFLSLILKKASNSSFYAVFFLVLIIYSPRYIFYGYIYLLKAIFLFVLIRLLYKGITLSGRYSFSG